MNKLSTVKRFAFAVLVLLFFFSCDLINSLQGDNYLIGHIPTLPANLADINTEFDDYNSNIPIFGETFPLCFSSNRNSYGKNFDLVYKLMDIYFSKKTGEFLISENTSTNLDVYTANENIQVALNKINTPLDEFGPYLIPVGDGFLKKGMGYRSFQKYIFLHSNGEKGNQDIKMTHNTITCYYDSIYTLDALNSDADDAYPTLNQDRSAIYWSSNRDGNYHIYSTDLDRSDTILLDLIHVSGYTIISHDGLNSNADDKCPSITNNLMVFTSNREGGYGGFDLYYAYYENGNWSEPINFGSTINSEYDEYRPLVRSLPGEFDNDLMIFSSNRPEGKGGFDLYYVGIERKGSE